MATVGSLASSAGTRSGSALERVAEGKTIEWKSVRRQAPQRLEGRRPVSHSVCRRIGSATAAWSVLGRVRHETILTVGDVPGGFCESGGGINLIVVDSKVKLEINRGRHREIGFAGKLGSCSASPGSATTCTAASAAGQPTAMPAARPAFDQAEAAGHHHADCGGGSGGLRRPAGG